MPHLEPCPFCGSADIESQQIDTSDREGTPRALVCADCGARGPWDYVFDAVSSIEIERLWNARYNTALTPTTEGVGE